MRKPELNNSFDQKGLSYKQAGQQEQGKWIKVMLMHNLCDGIFCNAPYYGLPPTGFWVVILTDSHVLNGSVTIRKFYYSQIRKQMF